MKFTRRSLLGSILALPFLSKVLRFPQLVKAPYATHLSSGSGATTISFTSTTSFKCGERISCNVRGYKFEGRITEIETFFDYKSNSISYRVYAQDEMSWSLLRGDRL